jgi:hypothetical protein
MLPRREGNMQRRSFVRSSLGAVLGPMVGGRIASAEPAPSKRPQILELRLYRLRTAMTARFNEYAKTALVPALNRAGIKPVGAFSVSVGPNSPTVALLLPHANADSVVTLYSRLDADAEYKKTAAPYGTVPSTDPLFVRIESSLMQAFDSMPEVVAPSGAAAAASRVFELRTYESHSRAANTKKIEMFEAGGEIAIFKRLGMTPVFFARDVVGTRMPSLTYMLAFPDAAARDKGWAAFGDDPEWVKLRSTPGYVNVEIVSNTNSQLLRPTDYSQL